MPAAAMGEIDGNSLSTRVEVDGASREIALLASLYNHMWERLEHAFTQQKNFSAAAAHELKTPLACLRTNLEVLQLDENPTAEELREAVAVAGRNTNRLIGLIEELVFMNAIEKPETIEPVAQGGLFGDILNELMPVISEKELHVSVEVDGLVLGIVLCCTVPFIIYLKTRPNIMFAAAISGLPLHGRTIWRRSLYQIRGSGFPSKRQSISLTLFIVWINPVRVRLAATALAWPL